MLRSKLPQKGGTLPSGYRSRSISRFHAMQRNRSGSSVLWLAIEADSGKRLVGLLALPQTKQQHGKFSCHRHRPPLLGPRRSIGRQHQAISAQGALRAEGTEDVPRGANEQPTQVGVAALGYAQLWIALSALIAPRTQAGVGAHIAHIFKTLWIFDLQNKIERSESSHSRDLLQPKRLRIFWSGQNVDLTLEHGNARAQLGQCLHAWGQSSAAPFRAISPWHLMKTFARRITHCVTQALQTEAHRINKSHARPHQTVAQFNTQQILLRLLASMAHQIKQRAIHPTDTRQHHPSR